MITRLFTITLVLLLAATTVSANNDAIPVSWLPDSDADYFPEEARFDENILTPEEFLGYTIGSHFTRFDRIVAYFEYLEEVSDRLSLQVIGQTYQKRPQIVATITSPQNHQNLEEIRRHHVETLHRGARNADAPSVVSLLYSVHGNEPSGAEAALLTAYYLVAETGEETQNLLQNLVVHIDPSQNPDGTDRAVHWFNSYKSFPPVADPADIEHNEGWPNGRSNHFLHDLNRDWLPLTQQESRNRVAFFHQWYPNIQIDFHEMGTNSTYYLEPTQPVRTWNPVIPDERYEVLSPLVAGYQIAELERIGALFWTKEVFDNISPIYGSTYPDIFGAIGITFEVGSSRGLLQESVHGDVTFASTILKQVRTGLGTLRAAYGERQTLHDYQRRYFRTAPEQAAGQSVRAFLFGDDKNRNLSVDFLEYLLNHNVEVYQLSEDTSIGDRSFSSNHAWVVPTEQANYRIIHDIFQPNEAFRDSVFYDITAWSQVQGYGVHYAPFTGRGIQRFRGDRVSEAPSREGGVIGASTNYAYVFDWSDARAPSLLYALQQKGYLVRTAHQPFRTRTASGDLDFGYGSVIVAVSEQPQHTQSEIHLELSALAEAHHVKVYALESGLSLSGIDLGSRHAVVTPKPEVAIVFGSGVRWQEAGEAWFLLNKRVGIPVVRIDKQRFERTDLSRYTTIVLVEGSYSDWSEETTERLKRWVREGGTLIAQSGAARWAIDQELVRTTKRSDQNSEGDSSSKTESVSQRFAYGEQDDRRRADRIPGVILQADLDLSHPVAFGAPSDRQLFLKTNQLFLTPSTNPFATVAQYTDQAFIGGHLNEEKRRQIAGTAAIVAEPVGRGTVVLFSENPNFRSYWHTTSRLFINSIFHGHAVR